MIERRFDHSRLNLIHLLPGLASLRVYDNSADADPARDLTLEPMPVLATIGGRIVAPRDLSPTPGWAKPIVAAALSVAVASTHR